MPYWFFLINFDNGTFPYIVQAHTQNNAIQRLHVHLYAKDSMIWTDRWEDLHDDIVEYGNHELYGPFKEIPTLI